MQITDAMRDMRDRSAQNYSMVIQEWKPGSSMQELAQVMCWVAPEWREEGEAEDILIRIQNGISQGGAIYENLGGSLSQDMNPKEWLNEALDGVCSNDMEKLGMLEAAKGNLVDAMELDEPPAEPARTFREQMDNNLSEVSELMQRQADEVQAQLQQEIGAGSCLPDTGHSADEKALALAACNYVEYMRAAGQPELCGFKPVEPEQAGCEVGVMMKAGQDCNKAAGLVINDELLTSAGGVISMVLGLASFALVAHSCIPGIAIAGLNLGMGICASSVVASSAFGVAFCFAGFALGSILSLGAAALVAGVSLCLFARVSGEEAPQEQTIETTFADENLPVMVKGCAHETRDEDEVRRVEPVV